MKAGRKQLKFSAEQKIQLEALAAYLNREQIADFFGIARPTLAAMMERDPEIAMRYSRGKAKAIVGIAQSLIKKAREGDTTSQIFYLKTQAGWSEKPRDEPQDTPTPPANITFNVSPAVGEIKITNHQE